MYIRCNNETSTLIEAPPLLGESFSRKWVAVETRKRRESTAAVDDAKRGGLNVENVRTGERIKSRARDREEREGGERG